MRRNNPKRATRMDNRCGCEHINHMSRKQGNATGRVGHRYLQVEAGEQWAWYVGHVCDECARTCMKDWLVKDHVHGEGDCHHTPAG